MTRIISGFALLAVSCLAPGISFAHHSVAGFFDPGNRMEIEGVLTKVRWRNPHTVFQIEATDEAGEVTTWTIESGALGVLRSRGLAREFVQVGDRIRIYGDMSLRSRPEMFARNILLSNGKEVMMTNGSSPHFTSQGTGGMLESEYDDELIAAAQKNADRIFRVWTTNIEVRSDSGSRLFSGQLPLTADAAAKRSEYDASDEALLGCTSWSMPRLMANPLPMEFHRDGDKIVLQFEENDSVRIIHLQAEHSGVPDESSIFGYSTGRWDGETFVVETTNITPDRFDNSGTPFSEDMHLLERFTASDDGSRLEYQITVTDTKTFKETLESGRHWDWRPEIVVGAYDCDQDQRL